ncbi:MAG TPA: response regulator [Verrucomicrobiae bacterium]|jgi:CheY-like chemotaxis protein|nr:response regulator [Verrucomicrobiae bacterium]
MQKHILVVADAVEVVETIPITLELAGHKVTLADCGLDAILWAERMLPDLILVDSDLPDMGGVAIIGILRWLPATAGLASILLEPRCRSASAQSRSGRPQNGALNSSDLLRQVGFALTLCNVVESVASRRDGRVAPDAS